MNTELVLRLIASDAWDEPTNLQELSVRVSEVLTTVLATDQSCFRHVIGLIEIDCVAVQASEPLCGPTYLAQLPGTHLGSYLLSRHLLGRNTDRLRTVLTRDFASSRDTILAVRVHSSTAWALYARSSSCALSSNSDNLCRSEFSMDWPSAVQTSQAVWWVHMTAI